MSINDGGPAYPQALIITGGNNNTIDARGGDGMSLRDNFAGLAMQGMNANPAITFTDRPGKTAEERIAEFAYKQADAMLAEKERWR